MRTRATSSVAGGVRAEMARKAQETAMQTMTAMRTVTAKRVVSKGLGRGLGRGLRSGLSALVLVVMAATTAMASGPRWVGGTPFFWPVGFPVAWYTTHPTYYTDPGDLSASVPHAAADAMVAQAAAVWNVPQASLVLAQGGSLNEHVTGASILSGGTVQMPADVQSTNGQQKPIAVIYDTDGSVIDALLGAGGSDPAGCLQTGVVESVDSFASNSTIQHALLILNGRCTGPAPEQQMQMQYQLVRAFGRVLGIGWSQTNDNVFTQSPAPTPAQVAHWPIMHPIDVICGAYTYQCLSNPFTLRPDDISALSQLYFIGQGQGASLPGKEDTWAQAGQLYGYLSFPNGQGMEGVNVTVRRHRNYTPAAEDWQEVSTVSGHQFRRMNGTPVTALDGGAMSSIGYVYAPWEGYFNVERVPIEPGDDWESLVATTEPINPLYTGPYALMTQAAAATTMAPSGSPMQEEAGIVQRYSRPQYLMTANDAVSSCNAGADGSEGAPAAMAQTGWWQGVLCGYGHSSWAGLTMKANRTATVEVTALDETGAASAVKAMPMIGVWQASDGLGQAPTVAATPVSFNTAVVGMSSVQVTGTGSALRMVITDQRGAGRPDFAYQARVLYADAVQPANVSATGGTVVILGSGFRTGNQVWVNGVAAQVTGVTPTAITAVVPTLRALGSTRALLANVVVQDVTTGGTSTMTGALGYGAPGERLQMVSAPTGTIPQGRVAGTAFAVQVLGNDGVTPVAGETVVFSVTRGAAQMGVCGGAASCTVQTDGQGRASTTVTPTAAGTLTLKATTPTLSVSAAATVSAPDVLSLLSAPAGVATVGAATPAAFAIRIMAADGVTPRSGQAVVLTAEAGAARLEVCGAAICNVVTDATGMASTAVTPLVAGRVTLDASGAAGAVSTSFTAAAETMRLLTTPGSPMPLRTAAAVPFAVTVVGGDGVTPVAGEPVVFSAMGGGVVFGACGGPICTVPTNAQGVASTTVTASLGGAVTLQAAAASGAVTKQLVAGVRTLQTVSVPTGTVPVGSAAATAMAVRVVAEDGVTPVAGETVQFSTTAGSALLGACGAANCAVVTDATGTAQTTVMPRSAGQVTVAATAPEGSVTTTITGQALPDVLQVLTSSTGATVWVGDVLNPGVSVRLVQADGVTPVVGQTVTFAVTQGTALLGSCGGASCTAVTDTTGTATSTVSPQAAGAVAVTVSAAAATQATAVVWMVLAQTRVRALAIATPVTYVAEGRAVSWTATAAASDNSAAVEGVTVLWTGAAGMTFASAASPVAAGTAVMQVQVAGLAAGAMVQGTACAWTTVCQPVSAQGVGAAAWHVTAVGGGNGTGAPMVVQVSDDAGHPVLGVPVSVQQTVVAWQQACPALGRCPNPPVLRTATAMVSTDAAGRVTVSPMALGSGEVLQVSFSAGVSGAAQIAVVQAP